jgi:hypothetical protein
MSLTLSKIAQRVWRETGFSVDIAATGGSTTTIVDANSIYTADDALIGGTAVVVRDAGGLGAAPEGEYARVSDYVAGTTTFTLGTALTAGISAGDSILLASPKIRLEQMKQAINDGLANLGTISLVDTSLAAVAGTYSYNLPVGLKIKELKDVLIFDGNQYRSIIGYVRNFPAAPAATGTLEFTQIPYSNTLKIVYEGVHPTLSAFNSTVSETIQEELAVSAAMDKALAWFVSKRGESALGTFAIQRWNDAKQTLQMQKVEKPILRAKSAPKFFISSRHGSYPGDINAT